MKIVIAMDSFKGTIGAGEACQIVAEVIAEFVPGAQLLIKPMADGGEGTAKAMLAARDGRWVNREVMGPLPNMKANAGFVWFDSDRTALVEMASASGLELLEPGRRNPLETTTYGTGELIKAAAKRNPEKILLAVGGSATVDGGVGAAMALGWRFLDKSDNPIALGGGELHRIQEIIPPQNLDLPAVEVLCDVENRLCGRDGAARIFGPQKGATPQMVERLEKSLGHVARLVKSKLGKDIDVSRAGAAGGLAAGAVAFMNATLVSGARTIIDFTNLQAELADADWIITGEGCFDRQSLYGKVVCGVVETAAESDTAVAVIAGQVNLPEVEYQRIGIRTAVACKPENMSLEQALANSRPLLRSAAQRFVRNNFL